jgi:hypothetical protein
MNSLRLKCWLHVWLLVVLIYSTLGVVRPICEYLKANTPFSLWMNVLMIGSFVSLGIGVCSKVRLKSLSGYFLCAIAVVIYLLAFQRIQHPEEKLHLLEYGLLGYLTWRAFRVDFSRCKSYGLAFLLSSLLGWGDELIQEILPNRYYQTEDVVLNIFSSFMGLFLTYIFDRELRLNKY